MATKTASTLAKGLRLLGAILDDGGRSSLHVIAASADIPLSTAHRLALTLEAEGFLERSKRGYYLPGPSLRHGSTADAEVSRIAARLRKPLAHLARTNAGYAHFGVLEDGMVTYLVKEGASELPLFTAEKKQLEAYCSGIGKALLAELPQGELDDYLAGGPFIALTPRTLTDPRALRSEIEQVRRAGVALDRGEVSDGLYCIAVPVKTADGRAVGGVSVSLIGRVPERPEQQRIARRLRALAKAAAA